MRRAFLMRPLSFSRISSRFTNSRFHPILRTWRAHRGVDYAADAGTPVEVTADGVITRRGWSDTYGRVIDVRHGNGFLTRYAHLQGFAGGTAVGSRVRQGQTIGYVGMTGMATGPHLHYEMHVGGRPVDPLAIELPADDPVPGDAFDRWTVEKDERFALLMQIPVPTGYAAAARTSDARAGNPPRGLLTDLRGRSSAGRHPSSSREDSVPGCTTAANSP